MSIILSLAAIRGESGQQGRHAQPARSSGKDPVRIYGTRIFYGLVSDDFLLGYGCTRLRIPLIEFPEVR
jgi:hypothetical protein